MQYDPNTYERNKMDISDHEATFAGFLRWAGYVSLASIALCIFLYVFYT